MHSVGTFKNELALWIFPTVLQVSPLNRGVWSVRLYLCLLLFLEGLYGGVSCFLLVMCLLEDLGTDPSRSFPRGWKLNNCLDKEDKTSLVLSFACLILKDVR